MLDWSVSSSASWLSLNGDVTGQGNGSVNVHFTAHTDSIDRTAELNVISNTASNSPLKIALKQLAYASEQPCQQISINIFLEGPYQTAHEKMVSAYASTLSLDSPFIQAPRHVDEIPHGCIDWVKIALCTEPNTMPIAQRACFLHENGQILDIHDNGTISEIIEWADVPEGTYHLMVQQSNHLMATSKAMTMQTGVLQEYDFTSSGDMFFNSRVAREMMPGCWAVRTGDLNQDGQVNTADYVIWYNAYKGSYSDQSTADVNMNATIDINDCELILDNARTGAGTVISQQPQIESSQ